MKPHVFTSTTSAARSPSPASSQPPISSLAASSSESTSFLAQPSVTRRTERLVPGAAEPVDDTPADYGKAAPAKAAGLGVAGLSPVLVGGPGVQAQGQHPHRSLGDGVLAVHEHLHARRVTEHHLDRM